METNKLKLDVIPFIQEGEIEMSLALDLRRSVLEDDTLRYLVGPVKATDLIGDIEYWNTTFTELIPSGFLLMDMGYELRTVGEEVFVEVSCLASEWYASDIFSEEDEE